MPRKEGQKALSVPMSETELEHVHKLAKARKYTITADYVRSLIEQDAIAQGKAFKFSVNRGGYREREN